MNRREFVISTSGVAVALITPFSVVGQRKAIEPDRVPLPTGKAER